jgi:hypothetical protein
MADAPRSMDAVIRALNGRVVYDCEGITPKKRAFSEWDFRPGKANFREQGWIQWVGATLARSLLAADSKVTFDHGR